MARLTHNILANGIGRAWMMLMALVFVPVYVRVLGIEAYGLIGFFVTMQASLLAIFDLGFSATVNREMARISGQDADQRRVDTLHTLEIVYWVVCLLAGLLVIGLASPIARYWINAPGLTESSISTAIQAMGLTIALQMPFSLYRGAFAGLQYQVTENILLIGQLTLRFGGAAAVILYVSPTIEAYFFWQILAAGVTTILMGSVLWWRMPKGIFQAHFRWDVLRGVKSYALMLSVSGIVSLAVTQLDKLMLSKLVSMEQFGYYSIATTISVALWSFVIPINGALFPRFAQEENNTEYLAVLYHTACQVVSVILLPVSMLMMMFSGEILLLWTGDEQIVENAHWLVTFLVCGTALSGLVSVGTYLLAAIGKPGVVLRANVVLALVLIPSLFFVVPLYSVVGASVLWALVNAGYLFLVLPAVHTYVVKESIYTWVIFDVMRPGVAALIVVVIGKLLMPEEIVSQLWLLIWLCGLGLVAMVAALLVAPRAKARLLLMFSALS